MTKDSNGFVSWKALIPLLALIVSVGSISMASVFSQHTDSIHSNSVSKREFDQIDKRLERIEQKVDRLTPCAGGSQ